MYILYIKYEELNLPPLYWISKFHKCSYKQRYIAESANCSFQLKVKVCMSYQWSQGA